MKSIYLFWAILLISSFSFSYADTEIDGKNNQEVLKKIDLILSGLGNNYKLVERNMYTSHYDDSTLLKQFQRENRKKNAKVIQLIDLFLKYGGAIEPEIVCDFLQNIDTSVPERKFDEDFTEIITALLKKTKTIEIKKFSSTYQTLVKRLKKIKKNPTGISFRYAGYRMTFQDKEGARKKAERILQELKEYTILKVPNGYTCVYYLRSPYRSVLETFRHRGDNYRSACRETRRLCRHAKNYRHRWRCLDNRGRNRCECDYMPQYSTQHYTYRYE